MKILIISTCFYPLVGGVEDVLENLAINLSKDNDVRVLTSLDTRAIMRPKGNKFVNKMIAGWTVSTPEKKHETYHVKRIWINWPESFWGYLSFPYRLFASSYSLIRYINQIDPDVINYHFPNDSSLYVYIASFFTNKPIVMNMHGNDVHIFARKKLYSNMIRSLLEKASKIIVNSDYMKKELGVIYSEEEKVTIIPNGIDISHVNSIQAKKYYDQDYLYFVGRLVHKKGVDVLIEAFHKANIPDLKLVIEGYAEEYESLKRLIAKLGEESRIELRGLKNRFTKDEKFAYLKGALFGIIPSRIEPFGIVALEFLASGTPLIASKTGGMKTFLKNDYNTLFFENGNVDELAEKLRVLYKSPKLRTKLSENGLKTASEYDNKKIADMYLTVYSEVAK